MSLINDALKRAKEVQPPPVAAPELQLRPVESAQHRTANTGLLVLLLLLLLVVFGGLGAFFVLQGLRGNHGPAQAGAFPAPGTPSVREGTLSQPSTPTTVAPTAIPPPAPVALVPPKPAAPAPATLPATANSPVAVAPPTATGPLPAGQTNEPAPVVVTDTPPKPVPKLQGIYYRPGRPAAVVSGRTLFVGDRMGEYRVRAITPDSVTLTSPGQTNVLSLSD